MPRKPYEDSSYGKGVKPHTPQTNGECTPRTSSPPVASPRRRPPWKERTVTAIGQQENGLFPQVRSSPGSDDVHRQDSRCRWGLQRGSVHGAGARLVAVTLGAGERQAVRPGRQTLRWTHVPRTFWRPHTWMEGWGDSFRGSSPEPGSSLGGTLRQDTNHKSQKR